MPRCQTPGHVRLRHGLGGPGGEDVAQAAGARGDAPWAGGALGRARDGDDLLRRRPDGHGRLPDLAGRRASGDPLARGGDRRRPVLRDRAAGRALPRASRLARPRPADARQDCAWTSTQRIEPLAPAGLAAFRRGDLLSRLVSDVDALQNLFLRGLGPPLVALASGAVLVGVSAGILPAAGLALAVGLVAGAAGAPLLAGRLGHGSTSPRAAARGELTAELVEILRGAPELAVYGREQDAIDRLRHADRRLARLARRDAIVAGIGESATTVVSGLTLVAVLAARRRRAPGRAALARPRRRARAAHAGRVRGDGDRSCRPPRSSARRSRPASGCSS